MFAYFEQNREKPWQEWLKVSSIFPRTGKQGILGIMKDTENLGYEYVFKMSQGIDHLIEHEAVVMKSLTELANFSPNYCRLVGAIICTVDPVKLFEKNANPFCDSSKKEGAKVIEKEVLLMEYLPKSYKLYNIIRSKIEDKIAYSLIKQSLLAVAIAQKKKRFTHYDLHSNNIMVRRCKSNVVMLYVIDEQNKYCVPTYGYYPVIIDCGFAYSQAMEGEQLWCTMNHTDVGFTCDRFDAIADPKLFMVTVSDELNTIYDNKNSHKIRNIAHNLYDKLNIDWSSGWDKYTKKCATDFILDIMQELNLGSRLFKEYECLCVDILKTLIVLPIEEQKFDDVDIAFTTFITEFIKIEAEIGSQFFCLYLLKHIVDIARTVRIEYSRKETRNQAVNFFRQAVRERVDSVAKFCVLKNLHYEKMLCSLLCMAKSFEGLLYKSISLDLKQKYKDYDKLPIHTPEEIFAIIDTNIQTPVELNENSIIFVIDSIKEEMREEYVTKEEATEINSYDNLSYGMELYELLTKRKKRNSSKSSDVIKSLDSERVRKSSMEISSIREDSFMKDIKESFDKRKVLRQLRELRL